MGQYVPVRVRRAVARGVEFLDKKYGPIWAHFIDLDTFDISQGNQCVLGQLVPALDPDYRDDGAGIEGYDYATDKHYDFFNGIVQDLAFEDFWNTELRDDEADVTLKTSGLGFDSWDLWGDNAITYPSLQLEWERVIRKRQRAINKALAGIK